MNPLPVLIEYLVALCKSYYTWGLGLVLTVLAFAALKVDVPVWAWIAAAILGLFIAQFDVWVKLRGSKLPKNMVTLRHNRKGGYIMIEITNRMATFEDGRINVLVPKTDDIYLLRQNPPDPDVSHLDTIKDSDVCPDGGDVLRWSENDLVIHGGTTATRLLFLIGEPPKSYTMKFSLGADALGDWLHWLIPIEPSPVDVDTPGPKPGREK